MDLQLVTLCPSRSLQAVSVVQRPPPWLSAVAPVASCSQLESLPTASPTSPGPSSSSQLVPIKEVM